MPFKRVLSFIIVSFFVFVSAFILWAHRHHVIPIVMYHHIESSRDYKPNFVSPKSFQFQMDYLSRNQYNVITLDELVEGIKNKKAFKPNTVVITFDDGSVDNYTEAFPVLRSHHFPAMFFIISSFINKPEFLSLEQIKEMQKNGMQLGSHTRSHAYLPDVSHEQLLAEIKDSKTDLERVLAQGIDYLAYPVGGFNEEIKQIVKESGYKGACTTNRGFDHYNQDVYELKRIRLSEKDSTDLKMWWKLSGYYNLLRTTKNPS
jgi:peptidoglycan/xylan/chitin deacetylase (PgdA/CDA1 family)